MSLQCMIARASVYYCIHIIIIIMVLFEIRLNVEGAMYDCKDMQNLTDWYFTGNKTAMICISYYASGWNTEFEDGEDKLGLYALSPSQCPHNFNLLAVNDTALCALLLLEENGLSAFAEWKSGKCEGWRICDTQSSSRKAGGPTASTSTSAGTASTTTTQPATRATSASGQQTNTNTYTNNQPSGGKKRKSKLQQTIIKLRKKIN